MSFPSLGWRAGLPLVVLPATVLLPSPFQARAPEPMVRVLLQESSSLVVGAGPSVLRIGDGRGRTLMEIPPGERLQLQLSGSRLVARRQGPSGVAQAMPLPSAWAWIAPKPRKGGEALLSLQRRRYRGRLLVRPSGGRLQAINLIGVESYLPSVVGSEMPTTWPQAALRAQAVAARTYALRQRRPKAPFDLKATVASQVYKGVEAETPSTREAVRSTRSQVLVHGSSLIEAVFHSSSGGSTENSGEIWSKQLPYLVSVPDFDENSPVREWRKRIEPWALVKAFGEIGGAHRIDVLQVSSSGRIRRARVTGPRGVLMLTGGQLRQRLGLKSTLASFDFQPRYQARTLPRSHPYPLPPPLPGLAGAFPPSDTGTGTLTTALTTQPWLRRLTTPAPALVVSGRGYGHGVGMSQWGAYGLAKRGKGYEQILQHFYRGARIRPYTSL